MGVLSRMSTIFKAKVNHALDQVEDPRETLDYSYQKQLELLQKVKRSLADVVTARKQVEMQKAQMEADQARYTEDAKKALTLGREDLARAALDSKAGFTQTIQDLDRQIAELKTEEAKMEDSAKRLEAKITSFRTQKEVIKAQYSSAEAHVRLGEAASGIGEELADVGMAVDRAKDKTEKMRARASALDDLQANGSLPDVLAPSDPVQSELQKVERQSAVDAELASLKKEVGQ